MLGGRGKLLKDCEKTFMLIFLKSSSPSYFCAILMGYAPVEREWEWKEQSIYTLVGEENK